MLRAFGLGAAMLSNGNPPPRAVKSGPVTALLVLVVVGIVAAYGMHRDLSVALLVITPFVIVAIILIGAIVGALGKSVATDSPDKLRRMKQVVDLLSADCPICRALPGITCKADTDHPYAIVDTQWHTLCHFARIEKAVRYHMVSRAEMIAQFGGDIPEGLNI